MTMKKILKVTALCAIVFFAFTNASFSQCKSVAKQCLPGLAPYIYTGQLNSTILYEGESAELVMTFTAGQEYRILTCTPKYMGTLQFSIYDKDRKLIFSNKNFNNVAYWDFKVSSTEDYTIQVSVPYTKHAKAGDISASGCVAVLVGFKNEN